MMPKASELRSLMSLYLVQCSQLSAECLDAADRQDWFKTIFHVSLSTEGVLAELAGPALRPSLNGARSIVLRIPALVAMGQVSVAEGELRRFLELTLWTVYFTDHRREWSEFEGKSGKGFSRDSHLPISYAAHRELSFYLEYARELMGGEPSGLGVQSVNEIKQAIYTLNAAIHPGKLARNGIRVAPYDKLTAEALRHFARLQKATFSAACLLLSAFRRDRFDNFTAGTRSHFEWLICVEHRRSLRKGPFGLA